LRKFWSRKNTGRREWDEKGADWLAVYAVCALLTVAVFFAKDFIFYDFHMEVSDYDYVKSDKERQEQAETSIWFTYGEGGKELQYGMPVETSEEDIRLY